MSDMHKDLSILTLSECRQLHFSFEIFKTVNSDSNYGLKKFYTPVVPVSGCILRCNRNRNFIIPRLRTSMGQRAIRYRGPVFWNCLPLEAKSALKFDSFKQIVSGMVHQLFGNHPT